jgi:anaerobic magnesium-protoporphyrin IX monomethyl ester cyclase
MTESGTRSSAARRVLFLIPPQTSRMRRDFASSHLAPSLGVASIIGSVRRDFSDVGFIDAHAGRLSLGKTVKRVLDFKPDVLAVSALTIQINDAADVVATLKKAGLKAQVIIGGPHASKIPEETLREFPCFDFAGAGEGEELMREFLAAIGAGGDGSSIRGLYARRDNAVASPENRPFIDDLDALPFPDWSQIRWENYRALFALKSHGIREVPVAFTRGCPFQCIFCAKIMGNRVRKRSVARVVEEIERDVDLYQARQILFTDETFTVDRASIIALSEEMRRRSLEKKISWICNTRPDLADEELLTHMRDAGCGLINFGVDSLEEESLRAMNKGSSIENAFQAVRTCRKLGIRTEAAYLLGMPTDTKDSIRKTIRAAAKIDSDFATFAILVPFPGTEIMDMAEKGEGGLVLLSRDWRLYGKQLGHALETRNLNRRALEALQRAAYYHFYLRPRRILSIFRLTDIRIVYYLFAHALTRLGIGPGRESAK